MFGGTNASSVQRPTLTEPGVSCFLNATLKQCHAVRETYHNQLFNGAIFLAFIVVIAGMLLYSYKGQLTPEERRQKSVEKEQYILSKIHNYQDAKTRDHQGLITGLPKWENNN